MRPGLGLLALTKEMLSIVWGGPRAQRSPKAKCIPRKRMNGTFDGGRWSVKGPGDTVEGPTPGVAPDGLRRVSRLRQT